MGTSVKVPVFSVEFGQRVQCEMLKSTLVCLGPVSNNAGKVAFWNENTRRVVNLNGCARVSPFPVQTCVEGILLKMPEPQPYSK